MKTIRYFSRLMLIAAAALVVGSCETNNDIPFQLSGYGYGYVIQTQSAGTTYFTPVIAFQTMSSTSFMESATVNRGTTPLSGDVYFDSWFETDFPPANGVTDLTALDDRYILSATDNKGKTTPGGYIDLSFEAGDAMSFVGGATALDAQLTYAGQTVTAVIGEVTNATHYMFIMVPVVEGAPFNGPQIRTLLGHVERGRSAATSGPQTISTNFSSSTHDYWIYPAAASITTNANTSENVILIVGEGRLLTKGATSLQEPE